MKFSALFLILILLVSPCFSATQSKDKNTPAKLPVTWDLSAIEDFYVAEFGFGSSEQEVKDISLTTDQYTEGSTFTASADVGIWWNITAPTTVSLNLLPGSNLSAGGEKGIAWSVSWSADEDLFLSDDGSAKVTVSSASADSGSNKEVTVVTHTGTPGASSSTGNVTVTVKTADAFHNLPGTYNSTLTLGVEVI